MTDVTVTLNTYNIKTSLTFIQKPFLEKKPLCRASDRFLFPFVNGLFGRSKSVCVSSLDFYKDHCILVNSNNVTFACAKSPVQKKNLVSLFLKIFARQLFAFYSCIPI